MDLVEILKLVLLSPSMSDLELTSGITMSITLGSCARLMRVIAAGTTFALVV